MALRDDKETAVTYVSEEVLCNCYPDNENQSSSSEVLLDIMWCIQLCVVHELNTKSRCVFFSRLLLSIYVFKLTKWNTYLAKWDGLIRMNLYLSICIYFLFHKLKALGKVLY